jgi:hypothetical protein
MVAGWGGMGSCTPIDGDHTVTPFIFSSRSAFVTTQPLPWFAPTPAPLPALPLTQASSSSIVR